VADVESTLVDGGLLVVTPAAPGTTALTTAILDNRPGRSGQVAGALVVLESVTGPPVRAVTVSDARGTFAFIDVPVPAEGTCLRITVLGGGGIGSFEYVDAFDPLAYFATWELDSEPRGYEGRRCSAA
jgi:hypothetical protein